MSPKRKHKGRPRGEIVNALDHPGMELQVPPSEYTMLPEFTVDAETLKLFEPIIHSTKPVREALERVDLWEEIRKHLTDREFQIFELRYRYSFQSTEIAKIANITDSVVSKHLSNARDKLKKAMNSEPENGQK
jgi:RNA polymerase sigma factor (sigma-70 family)